MTVVVQRAESDQPLHFTQPPGTRVALHSSSMGKALLAFNAPLQQRAPHRLSDLEQLTPKTHATVESLGADLDAIRAAKEISTLLPPGHSF